MAYPCECPIDKACGSCGKERTYTTFMFAGSARGVVYCSFCDECSDFPIKVESLSIDYHRTGPETGKPKGESAARRWHTLNSSYGDPHPLSVEGIKRMIDAGFSYEEI